MLYFLSKGMPAIEAKGSLMSGSWFIFCRTALTSASKTTARSLYAAAARWGSKAEDLYSLSSGYLSRKLLSATHGTRAVEVNADTKKHHIHFSHY